MARAQLARAVHCPRVHPLSARNIVAHTHRRPRGPRQERAAWPAMEIDGDVDPFAAQVSSQTPVLGDSLPAASMRHGDDSIEVRVVGDDWRGRRLDQVKDAGGRKGSPERPNHRCGENHITDEPEAHEEDRQRPSVLDRGLVHQHHGNVVLDGVDAPARLALQPAAVVHEVHRGLAVRADQNLEEGGVDGHVLTIGQLKTETPDGGAPGCERIRARDMTATLLLVALLAQAPAAEVLATPATPATASIGRAYYLFLQGLSLEEADDLAGAITNYRQAIELAPRVPEFHTQLAALYAGQNQLADAKREAEAALAVAPRDPEANRLLGWMLYLSIEPSTGQSDRVLGDAIAHLEVALTDDDPDPRAQLWLSDLYVRRGDGPKAIALLKKFLAERPAYPEALRMLARAYELTGDSDAAGDVMETLSTAAPDLFEARVRQIGRLEAAGRWREAIAGWADLMTQDPTAALYRTRYAAALVNTGDFPKARQVLADAAREAPRSAAVWYLSALLEGRAGDAAAADAAVARIVALNPSDARAPLAVARVRIGRKDYAGAVKALEARVTSPLPSDLSGGFYTEMAETLSGAYDKLGKKRQASDALAIAQKRDPQNERLLFALATAYDQDGRKDDAEKSLRTLLAANAQHADALNYLGYMFAEQSRNLPEAVDLITRALAIQRDNPSYLDSLGWAYFKMGQFEKARPPLEKAAAALPDVSVIQDHLGDVYLQLQRFREAGDAFDRAVKGDLDGVDVRAVTKKRDQARSLAAAGRS